MFRAFEFCLPTNATKVPAGPEWLHQIQHDDFRIRVERDGDRVRLIPCGGYDWTRPWIVESALKNRINVGTSRSRSAAIAPLRRSKLATAGRTLGVLPVTAFEPAWISQRTAPP